MLQTANRQREPYSALKGWMVANEVSQSDFAKTLGTTRNYISKKINGLGPDFSLNQARILAKSYGFPIAYFFTIDVPIKERSQ